MGNNLSARKYALNTSWVLLEKVSRIISGILVGVLVARYLGPAQFGIVSYALNVVAIFTVISSLGMDGIIVRELVIQNDRRHAIMGTAFWMRLAGAIIVVIGATFYSSLRDNSQGTLIVFLVSLSVLIQSFSVIDLYFQAEVKGKLTAINQVITLGISAVAKIIGVIVKAPVEYFAGMVLLEALITAVNQLLFYKKNGENLRLWKFTLQEMIFLLKHSWPIIASGLIMIIYQKMDQILIKRMQDLDSLGNYAAAARISEASFFIPVAVCAAIVPGIINNRDNRELQYKRLVQLYSVMLWSAFVICIGAMLFGDWVINFLYKEKFTMAHEIFKIHIWNCIVVFYGTAWGTWMVAENKQRYIIFYQCVSFALALFLNMKLIPIYGAKGAAYSLIITQFTGMFLSLSTYKPKLSWSLFLKALNPANLLDVYRYLRPAKQN